jgi:hypothetical protein
LRITKRTTIRIKRREEPKIIHLALDQISNLKIRPARLYAKAIKARAMKIQFITSNMSLIFCKFYDSYL